MNRLSVGMTVLIAAAAGLPAAAIAQPERDTRQIRGERERSARHFVSSSDLMGADLKNQMDEGLGSVDDFIVDRGSGKIVYGIVQSGDFLGLGGKQFALPYERLSYLPASKNFLVAMTEEQVEQQVEFLPENWSDLSHTTWMEKMEGWVSDEDDPDRRKKFREAASKEKKTIEGTVAEVNREDGPHGEQTVVRVLGSDGSTHDVVLGPSWYVAGSEHTPMRGDAVVLTAVECDGRAHAINAQVRGNTVNYRNGTGDAMWSESNAKTPRYILLSDLVGRAIDTAGTTSGEVQRALIETRSGRVAFIGMDPNENFLGLGDQIILVPWAAFRVGAESVSLDADNRAVERGMAWPDDVSVLNGGNTISAAYTPFGVREPSFEARDRRDWERRDLDRPERDRP